MAERDPLLGTSVGNYVIDKLIGEGGMGRVYLVHHANLPNKRYAFKVLLGDHAASTAMRQRFTREAERASQLDHPNVVKVVDFGQTPHGLLYIVMDYVDGPSLVSLIGERPMPAVRVVYLAREICRGLEYAHRAGIVHRDLKPENILVAAGPTPRIVDFGLALSIDQSDARLTESGMTMGTPLFAAPEQLLGRPIDHRADLYALGMTMFEMLTGGMTPFDGHAMEIVSAKTTKDTPRVSDRAAHLVISRELDDIVARLTRRNPVERYASAREVIDALDAIRPRWDVASDPGALAGDDAFAALVREASARREAAMPTGHTASAVDAPGPGRQARVPTQPIARSRVRSQRWWAAGVAALCSVAIAGSLWIRLSPSRTDERKPAPQVASAGAPPAAIAPGAAAAAPTSALAVHEIANDEIAMSVDVLPASARQRAQQAPRAALHTEPAAKDIDGGRHRPEPALPAVVAAARNPSAAPVPARSAPSSRPAAPPHELVAKLEGVDVSGSLPVGAVQRAIERSWPAIASCTPVFAGTVVAQLTIGEARRALDVRAVGSTPAASACIAAALAEVRTEAAPDVGDVKVTVRIAFVEKT